MIKTMKQICFPLCQIPNQLSFKTGFKTEFQKVDQHTGGNKTPQQQTPQGQSVAKPGTHL